MSSNLQGAGQVQTSSASAGPAESVGIWERSQDTAWQRYMADSQRDALLRTHALAKKPGLLMDFGCGHGRWTKLLMDLGWRAICLDLDAQSLGRAQRLNPSAKCLPVTRELRQLPARDGELQLLLCIGVYHVLESDWFLPEARRVLEPGGLFAGAFFNRLSGRGFYRYLMDSMFGGQRAYQKSYGPWKKSVRREGFEVLQEKGLTWFPLPCFSNSPIVPFCISLERRLGLQRLPRLSPWVEFVARKRS